MAGSLTIDNINCKVISSSPVATESQVIGVGQTWQDMTASRAIATTYTNSTGKPIMVNIQLQGTSGGAYTQLNINGSAAVFMYTNYNNSNGLVAVIPSGATYSVTLPSGSSVIYKWSELR